VYGRYKKGEEVELTSINVTLSLKVVYENIVLPLETDKPQE
jgi:hypothetical protein